MDLYKSTILVPIAFVVWMGGCLSDSAPRPELTPDAVPRTQSQSLSAGPVVADNQKRFNITPIERNDNAGKSVAIDGDTAVVGIPGAEVGTHSDLGTVHLFERNNGQWQPTQVLAPPGRTYSEGFGTVVDLEDDTLLVTAPDYKEYEGITLHEHGAAFIFHRQSGTWSQRLKLTASNGREGDKFGASAELNGSQVAIAAPQADRRGVDGLGSVYLFDRTGRPGGGRWVLQQELNMQQPQHEATFGSDVALEGDSLLVGVSGMSSQSHQDYGTAYVYRQTNGTWRFHQQLTPPAARDDAFFGARLALYRDTALVAAPGHPIPGRLKSGAVFVFERTNQTWKNIARLDPSHHHQNYLFGMRLALQGGTALVTGQNSSSQYSQPGSAVSLFRRTGGSWSETDRLQPSGPPNPRNSFGESLAVDGDTILVGAPNLLVQSSRAAGGAYSYRMIPDTDGDGVADKYEACPADPQKQAPGPCGCGTRDTDSDGDKTPDCNDGCPSDANKTSPGRCGCGYRDSDDDTDGDGTSDCRDRCYADPHKTDPGICGCQTADTDTDGDGTADCNDECPEEAAKIRPGTCGCGVGDTDGDGTDDCEDDCPEDPRKTDPGACGCGTAETDTDDDGTPDCIDGCPHEPIKTEAGICGCKKTDSDIDGDQTPDCKDSCPMDPGGSAPWNCDFDRDGAVGAEDNCPKTKNFDQVDTDGDGIGDACDEVDDRGDACADCTEDQATAAGPDAGVDAGDGRSETAPDGCAMAGNDGPPPSLLALLFGLLVLRRPDTRHHS
jgi:hypothetical protein